jgi:penicillin-binding protein 2
VPRLTLAIGPGGPIDPPEAAPIGFPEAALEMVREGMIGVTTRGTARDSQIKVPGMEMGGKTGTSQVRRISMAERAAGVQAGDWPWAQRDHALFVGFAPIAAPRYACAAIVEHGGGGSKVAAPIVRDILQRCQERNSGRPIAAAAPPPPGAG